MQREGVARRLYRRHIGPPQTADEPYGYWIFALGTLLSAVGVLGFLYGSTLPRPTYWILREAGIVLASVGLLGVLLGGLLRLPLGRVATVLGGLGAFVSLVGVAWFVVVYPKGWIPAEGLAPVLLTYLLGVVALALAVSVVPVVTSSPSTAERVSSADATGTPYYVVYHDDGWHWRLYAAEGRPIAKSGDAYDTEADARSAVDRVAATAQSAGVDVADDQSVGDAER